MAFSVGIVSTCGLLVSQHLLGRAQPWPAVLGLLKDQGSALVQLLLAPKRLRAALLLHPCRPAALEPHQAFLQACLFPLVLTTAGDLCCHQT